MHSTSYKRMKYLIDYYKDCFPTESDKIKLLDIGSYGMNGTYHDLFDDEMYSYYGLDMVAGSNVDIVPEDIYDWREISDCSFDIVVSGQAFEHIEFPWKTISEIERVLVPGGLCILIAPNAGYEHKAPKDCWRFYSDGMRALAKYAGLYVHHCSVAGMPKLEDPENWSSAWNDCVMVAQKRPHAVNCGNPFDFECRLLQDGKYHIMYSSPEAAIRRIHEKYKDGKRYILYGAGRLAESVMPMFSHDEVAFFADSNKEKEGSVFCGKEVIGIERLREICGDYHVLITTTLDISKEIEDQLREYDIQSDSLFLDEVL